MGNTLRVFSVILFLLFFVGFTTPSPAQENKLGLASSSSPGIVKQKVKESIELVPIKIADIDKALGTADLPDEKELLLKKKNGL